MESNYCSIVPCCPVKEIWVHALVHLWTIHNNDIEMGKYICVKFIIVTLDARTMGKVILFGQFKRLKRTWEFSFCVKMPQD